MKKKLTWLLMALFAVFVPAQFIPLDRSNPPIVAEFAGPAEVREVLRKSCYDCHSNETRWPFYSRIAPMAWLVVHDVREGREHLNFSEWEDYDVFKQIKLRDEIWEEVEEGEMPLFAYLIAHPEARPSEEDRTVLQSWSRGAAELARAAGTSLEEVRKRDRDH